jgi:adhesin/invasin
MRVSLGRATALLAILVAACSEGTGPNSTGLKAGGASATVTTSQGTLTITQGDGQFTQGGNFLSIDPAVQLKDLNGAAIAGEPITFIANQTTARVGLGSAPTANSFIVNTDANGNAIVRWKLGTTSAGQTLQAQAGSGGVLVTFRAIGTSNGTAPVIVKVQGDGSGQNDGQMRGNPARTNPTVLVQDGAAVALPNVDVTWTADKGGSGAPPTSTTDASGNAATVWTFGTSTGAHTMTARLAAGPAGTQLQNVAAANFTVTPLGQGTAMNKVNGDGQSVVATTGQRIGPKDPGVQIVDGSGTGISGGVQVRFVFSNGTTDCSGNTEKFVTANSSGVALTAWCLGTSPTLGTKRLSAFAGSLSTTFTATATVGQPTSLTIVQGDNCSKTVGQTCTPDPTVNLADANGNPVSGITITFTASGNGSLQNGSNSGNPISVSTDANGNAAARWTLGTTAGSQTLTAVASSGQTVTFNATAAAGASSQIIKINGDATVTTAGNFTPRDPTVQVLDQFGNAKNGVLINWVPDAGSSAFPSNINGGTTTPTSNTTGSGGTGQNGTAIARWQLNSVGTHQLTATVNGTTITTTFTGTAN